MSTPRRNVGRREEENEVSCSPGEAADWPMTPRCGPRGQKMACCTTRAVRGQAGVAWAAWKGRPRYYYEEASAPRPHDRRQ